MHRFNNPFSIDRAEQLGDRLFQFFAYHKSFEGLLKHKSLIIEGGRGSGKTMFYLYHTYQTKKKEAISNNISFPDFFSTQELIGIHFRCDSNFVPAFQHKGMDEDEWKQIFSHYLNINITKRLVEIVLDIQMNLNGVGSGVDFRVQGEVEALLNTSNIISSFESLLQLLKKREIDVINYVNNSKFFERPRLIVNGFLFNLIAKSLLEQEVFAGKTIHVFVDEYENLLMYQQKVFNTLIKHPDPIIFDLGMRNEGHKTYQTLSESEIIAAPHDYHSFNFEELSDVEYQELIIQICEKRLRQVDALLKFNNDDFYNIKYYLGIYDPKVEISELYKDKDLQKLRRQIKQKAGEEISKVLYNIDDPIILRLNLVLLERGEKPDVLEQEFLKFEENQPSKYVDWIHNNKMGIIFLSCKEKRKAKVYAGFNTFKSLSSGIIRYFIELCEASFKNANRNGFDFSEPRPLSWEEQTTAAYYVSKYKVNDIETYTPNSIRLKRFVMLLGKIFHAFHVDPKISEPERNHFTTQYDRLTDDARAFIKNANLYSVLQKREKTKVKSPDIYSDNFEFHLNHIYAPYFQISARRIRSVYLKPSILDILIKGDEGKARSLTSFFVSNQIDPNTKQLKIDLE